MSLWVFDFHVCRILFDAHCTKHIIPTRVQCDSMQKKPLQETKRFDFCESRPLARPARSPVPVARPARMRPGPSGPIESIGPMAPTCVHLDQSEPKVLLSNTTGFLS